VCSLDFFVYFSTAKPAREHKILISRGANAAELHIRMHLPLVASRKQVKCKESDLPKVGRLNLMARLDAAGVSLDECLLAQLSFAGN
jgi:hypothetical protein